MVDLPPRDCPECGADYPVCEMSDFDDAYYFRSMKCHGCGITWTETFQFLDYEID